VLGLYWTRVWQMLRGLIGRDAIGRRLLVNLFIAFLPAAVLGPLLDDVIEAHLFAALPVMIALALGGVVMIGLTRWQRKFFTGDGHHDPANARSYVDLEHLTWRRALLIGSLQCVAMWPGTSRSMMTIVGGMVGGLRPKEAAEFSFLLGLPTLGGACVYSLAKNITGAEQSMFDTLGAMPLVVGIAVATAAALRFAENTSLSLNSMDLLVLFMAIVVPNLPGAAWGDTNLPALAARVAVLFYALVVLLRDDGAQRTLKPVVTLIALGSLAVKGLV